MSNVTSLAARRMLRLGVSVVEPDDSQYVEMTEWGIKQTDSDTMHLIGETDAGARVSSPVIEYDADRGLARTSSGRYYTLIGDETGGSERARALWTAFKYQHGLVEV